MTACSGAQAALCRDEPEDGCRPGRAAGPLHAHHQGPQDRGQGVQERVRLLLRLPGEWTETHTDRQRDTHRQTETHSLRHERRQGVQERVRLLLRLPGEWTETHTHRQGDTHRQTETHSLRHERRQGVQERVRLLLRLPGELKPLSCLPANTHTDRQRHTQTEGHTHRQRDTHRQTEGHSLRRERREGRLGREMWGLTASVTQKCLHVCVCCVCVCVCVWREGTWRGNK